MHILQALHIQHLLNLSVRSVGVKDSQLFELLLSGTLESMTCAFVEPTYSLRQWCHNSKARSGNRVPWGILLLEEHLASRRSTCFSSIVSYNGFGWLDLLQKPFWNSLRRASFAASRSPQKALLTLSRYRYYTNISQCMKPATFAIKETDSAAKIIRIEVGAGR